MCGIIGLFGVGEAAAQHAYLGLYGLQHRGQESAGMTVGDGERIRVHKEMGLVANVFTDEVLAKLPGQMALGHVRYSTTGAAHVANAQPLLAFSRFGQISIAHNGNLTNTATLRERLLQEGSLFQTSTDSEVILNLIAQHPSGSFEEAVVKASQQLVGAFALVAMSQTQLIGLRDPLGNRPLTLGRLGGGYVLSSETCAFSTLGAEPVRDIAPGEMVVIDEHGVRSRRLFPVGREAFCVFEYIYFARPDTDFGDRNVHLVRKEIGRSLAREHPVEADVVIPTPDSAISAAMGYAEEAGIEYEVGLVKNRYVGRTFIQPTEALRQLGVRIKLNPIRKVLSGKRVVLLDDSIVRGTTTAKAIEMLRESGAKEVHMVVASPPFTHPCHYGIDVPKPDELIASHRTVEEIREWIGADSLHYLSFEGLYRAVGLPEHATCNACFSGVYPTDIEEVQHEADLLEERV